MRLDDLQVERYSRQIVLPEVGAEGQVRLLGARVAIMGSGVAAERALAYLAAAGIGRIAAPADLHAVVDPALDDVILTLLDEDPADGPYDAVVLVDERAPGAVRARRTFWLADGRAGELPPCPACARAAAPPAPAVAPALHALRDAVLGTIVATEVIKALLGIGTPLRGRVLTYDAAQAVIDVARVSWRGTCTACARAADAEGRP